METSQRGLHETIWEKANVQHDLDVITSEAREQRLEIETSQRQLHETTTEKDNVQHGLDAVASKVRNQDMDSRRIPNWRE